MPHIFTIPVDFILFGGVLVGIAFLHKHALAVSLTGLATILLYKFIFGFNEGPGMEGFNAFVTHEWVILAELFGLLTGFAILANHFERSEVPDAMPSILPGNWLGGLALLAIVFVMSAFLDNIAAAVIGGVIAKHVYEGRVSIAFLAAIVASSNAGGAGSVIGDTTTTLMWIAGISPLHLMPAFVGAIAAFAIIGVAAARAQHKFQPLRRTVPKGVYIHWVRLGIVAIMLMAIVGANISSNIFMPEIHHYVPVLAVALWLAILLTSLVRKPDWSLMPAAVRGAGFLVALVACAALMPVSALPDATWQTTLGLGLLSSIFDNIPLTALAIKQGGYDWSMLAYSVGIGGSMVWFGSSAGVAISNSYPEARSVGAWIRQGWFVPLGFVFGYFVKLAILGWHPQGIGGM